MKQVYIVSRGERFEGGQIQSVHENLESAIKSALEIPCVFEGGWEESTSRPHYWTNGCDFIDVQSFDVIE